MQIENEPRIEWTRSTTNRQKMFCSWFTILCCRTKLCIRDSPCEPCHGFQAPSCRRRSKLFARTERSTAASQMWGTSRRREPESASSPSDSVSRLLTCSRGSLPERESKPFLQRTSFNEGHDNERWPWTSPGHAMKILDNVTCAIPCWAALTELP